MFHQESWNHTDFVALKSKVKVTRHKNSASMGFCTLVSAFLFELLFHLQANVFKRRPNLALVFCVALYFVMDACLLLLCKIYFLGRLFDRVDLIKPVSIVCPCVRTYVRWHCPSVVTANISPVWG